MKRIVAILIITLISFSVFSQNQNENKISDSVIENSYIMNGEMKADIDTITSGINEIGDKLVSDYEELGTDGFIRQYKYGIITILLFVFLTILWARNRKI